MDKNGKLLILDKLIVNIATLTFSDKFQLTFVIQVQV